MCPVSPSLFRRAALSFRAAIAGLALAATPLSAAPQLLPGVYGYGLDRAANPAGFGPNSRILHVTTIEDNGDDANPTPGSLRAAIQASGPRVVVFDVSGVIELQKLLTAGTPVALRLNAVGNSFKVYRNGKLVLQALDDTYAAGKIALATTGAAADFDDVVVVRP